MVIGKRDGWKKEMIYRLENGYIRPKRELVPTYILTSPSGERWSFDTRREAEEKMLEEKKRRKNGNKNLLQ